MLTPELRLRVVKGQRQEWYAGQAAELVEGEEKREDVCQFFVLAICQTENGHISASFKGKKPGKRT